MSPLKPLARELGTTDRTLRRALEGGLVRAKRPTPRTVEIDVDERVYLRTHWHTLARLREALRTEPSVRAAVLFGSVARGEAHDASDIDLLVDLKDAAPGARLGVRRRLEEASGRVVQLVPVQSAKSSALLLAEILTDGRPLVDREGLWASLQASKAAIDRAAKTEARRREARLAELATSKAAA